MRTRQNTRVGGDSGDAALSSSRRRKLERSRAVATVGAALLGVAALFFLAALSEPGNVGGVLMLEAITAVPLVLVLRRLRRIRRELRELPVEVEEPAVESPAAPRLRPPEVALDTIRRFDLVLRPRLLALAALVVVAIGFPLFILKLSYDTASFDPRLVFIAIYSAVAIVLAVRARIVVAEGLLWRRGIVGYRPVSLDALDRVEFRRPRLSKNEGLVPTRLLRIADVYGRTVTLKPVYWANSVSLLAIVSAASRAQRLDVDPKAAALLMGASQRVGHGVPSWAYRREPLRAGRPDADADGGRGSAVTTFWTRRDANGEPKKAQPQRIIPILLVMGLMLPVAIFTGNVGKHVIRSVRCNSARTLWTAAPDTPSTGLSLDTAAARLSSTQLAGASARIYNLRVADIADRDNTAAVRRDAQNLEAGFDIQWTAGRDVVADMQLEQFPSHAAALTFQRDYAEDHCHEGDRAFAAPGIPGGVGFRCDCTSSTVTDRIGFVRGPLRLQAIAWNVSTKADHRLALQLANAANQLERESLR